MSVKVMPKTNFDLVINLDNADRTKVYDDESELFQRDGFREVRRIFLEKKDYLDHVMRAREDDDISDCRVHDTIFVAGDRGVGKTAFMLNIKRYIQTHDSGGLAQTFTFLKPVDPTLLEDHEHFLSIVVAQIVEEVDNSCRYKTGDGLETYYKSLRDLSESMRAVKERAEDRGIEEIVSSQNSLKLEQHAHNFFRESARVLGGKAIVILIDDVDMALERGVNVLEVVRKYLASPFAIPVVSGDINLYEEVLLAHFERSMTHGRPEWLMNERRSDSLRFIELEIKDLVDQYLAKVFPTESRIHLKSIYSILRQNRVKLQIGSEAMPYNIFKDIEIRLMNLHINQVHETQEVFWDNARLFIQYLSKKKRYIEIASQNFPYDRYYEYAQHTRYMEDGSELSIEYDKFISDTYFSTAGMSDLKETYLLTAQIYQYFKKRGELSLACFNDSNAIDAGTYHQKKALYSHFFSPRNPYFKPAKESLFDDLFVSKSTNDKIIKDLKDTKAGFILNLFCFDDYYSSYQTKLYLVAGKFFDLLITSLDPNFTGKDAERIVLSSPFNVNAPSHRYIQESPISSETEEVDPNLPVSIEICEVIASDIATWRKCAQSNPLLKFIPTNLLHKLANKFFNNVNVIKGAKHDPGKISSIANKDLVGETFLMYLQRVAAIFLNSVGSFESETIVANVNIGIGKNFNFQNIGNTSNAYRRNIKPLLDKANSDSNQENFVSLYYRHPIIQLILNNNDTSHLSLSKIRIGGGFKGAPKRKLIERLEFEVSPLYEGEEYGRVLEKTNEVLSQYAMSDRKEALAALKNRGRKFQRSLTRLIENQDAKLKYEDAISRFIEMLKEIEDAPE